MSNLTEQIQALEEKLLHADMRENPLLLDELLAKSFVEIGSAGLTTPRHAVVSWLLNKNKNDRWLLSNFSINKLSSDIVLAIYHAQKVGGSNISDAVSTRSSIWKRHDDHWKMMFHQTSKSNP